VKAGLAVLDDRKRPSEHRGVYIGARRKKKMWYAKEEGPKEGGWPSQNNLNMVSRLKKSKGKR